MKPSLFLHSLIILVAGAYGVGAGLDTASLAPDPGIPDTIRVESFTLPRNYNSFWVDVYIYNDEELRSVFIPLEWNSPDIICDSVYFDWSRAEYVNIKKSECDNQHQRLYGEVEIVFEPLLEPGYGWIFSVFFYIDSGTVDQVVTFDSTIWPPDRRLQMTLGNGLIIHPQFVPGRITLGKMPDSIVTAPGHHQLNVAADQEIDVIFPGDIKPTTINASSFIILGNYSGRRQGSMDYYEPARSASFIPTGDLFAGEKVGGVLTSDILTVEGNSVTEGHIWSYMIGSDGGTGDFSPPAGFPAGSSPSGITAADYDRDSDIDLAVSLAGEDSIVILFNWGDGNFESTSAYPAGTSLNDIISADMNSDGYPDLVAAGEASQTLVFLVNKGNGSFDPATTIPADHTLTGLTAADLDADGDVDIALSGVENPGSGRLSVLLNDGYGLFALDSVYALAFDPIDLQAADLDNDNDIDLVLSGQTDGVITLANAGRAEFCLSVTCPVEADPDGIVAGDFNSDTYIDFAVAGAESLHILINSTAGTFDEACTFAYTNGPYYLQPADLDGDGNIDLAAISRSSGTLLIYANPGDGILEPSGRFGSVFETSGFVAADLDGDSDIDLAALDINGGGVKVFLNNDYRCGDANGDGSINVGDIVFLVSHIFHSGSGPDPPETGDLNCDGNINVGDIIYLVNYVFDYDSPRPCEFCR